jgi:Polyketide cyclase / dehydrase and lipid transport
MAVDGMQGSKTVQIDAPGDRLWGMVSDVTKMGEWSPETFEADWIDGASGPAVGARFKGRDQRDGKGPK